MKHPQLTTLNDERLESFLSKIRNKSRISALITLTNMELKALASAIRHKITETTKAGDKGGGGGEGGEPVSSHR